MNELKQLREYYKEIMTLNYVRALLGWDQEVNMRNYKFVNGKMEQKALLAKLSHRRVTSKKLGDLISDAEKVENLSEIDAAMVRELRREYDLETKLPEELVEEREKASTKATQVWQKARKNNDFKLYQPYLEKNIEIARKYAEKLGTHPDPYSTLIDLFEPGVDYKWIVNIFNPLKPKLIEFVKKLSSAPDKPDGSIWKKNYDPDKQFELSGKIIQKLQFDLTHGRQDRSAHPFTTSLAALDTRITTRTTEPFPDCITSTIHEAGHALYEMGIKEDLHDTILCEGTSMGIHESQSRMWENIVGRSKEFWMYWYPTFQEYFPENLKGVSLDQFHKAMNIVGPSFIRVNADEVTYGLHIILRFELERGLIDDTIKVSELPELWNSKSNDLLGITPPNDIKGVLQDVHWSSGLLGYFPTYQLGNLYAAQFYAHTLKEMPNLHEDYKEGNYSNLLKYLRENIHQYGKVYRASDLVKRVTGEGLNPDYFIKYVEEKYYPIYGL